jgi:L-ribulose-5-phosphate 4-epimerase
MNQFRESRQAVLEAARKMSEKGLVTGTSGNVSLRLPSAGNRSLLAITPTSRPYSTLNAEDIPIIDFDGRLVDGVLAPSVETPLHIAIYQARQNVNAIIHTHSVYASAAAVAGMEIPPILEDQVAYLGGAIKLAEYAASGTKEQITSVVEALGDCSGALMSNHGVVGTGRTINAAFTACELIEKTAKIYFLALLTGKVNQLPAAAVKSLEAIYISFHHAGG